MSEAEENLPEVPPLEFSPDVIEKIDYIVGRETTTVVGG